jgi:hypothetical protein
MLAKAVAGSSKNITPNWLTPASNGPPGTVSCCTSATQNETFAARWSTARCRARSHEWGGDVRPDHRAPVTYATAGCDRGRAPTAPDIEHPLALDQPKVAEQDVGDCARQLLALGPDRRPVSVVPAAALGDVAFNFSSHVTPPRARTDRTQQPRAYLLGLSAGPLPSGRVRQSRRGGAIGVSGWRRTAATPHLALCRLTGIARHALKGHVAIAPWTGFESKAAD